MHFPPKQLLPLKVCGTGILLRLIFLHYLNVISFKNASNRLAKFLNCDSKIDITYNQPELNKSKNFRTIFKNFITSECQAAAIRTNHCNYEGNFCHCLFLKSKLTFKKFLKSCKVGNPKKDKPLSNETKKRE